MSSFSIVDSYGGLHSYSWLAFGKERISRDGLDAESAEGKRSQR